MTREQIGRALGLLIVAAIIVLAPYGSISFILWNLNFATWPTLMRLAMVFLIGAGVATYVDGWPSASAKTPVIDEE